MRIVLLIVLGLPAVASAEPPPVLVELFTSEGCSSCPPADRLLEKLDQEGAAIVLSEHVDYWNYLGWRDPFSSSQFSRRQSGYALRGDVYTPQIVVDGLAKLVGSNEAGVRGAIQQAARRPKLAVAIRQLRREGAAVVVDIEAAASDRGTLWLALAGDGANQVTRGENAGRHLRHVAVARAMALAKPGVNRVELPKDFTGGRVVAFVQDRVTLEILGAAEKRF
jgi:hypothetical protein